MTPSGIPQSLSSGPASGRRRILFVAATRIGDAVLSTGLLDHLLTRYPEAEFTIAAGPAAAPLFEGFPGLHQLIALPKQSFARHWLRLYRQTAGARWDMVVDLRGSALAWLLRAGDRRIIAKGDPHEHRVVQLGRVFDLSQPPAPHLWLRLSDVERASALIPSGSPVLAMAPAANWRGKQWPSERFAALARKLTAPGSMLPNARVAVFAAPHERAQATALLDALPAGRIIDLLDCGDLLTVAAALARTDFFIGNDSGLMHMAAAMGVPALGLFGPSRETHYAPWGPKGAVIRTPQSLEELTSIPGYHHLTTDTLMTGLTVEAVEAAAWDLARRTILEPAA